MQNIIERNIFMGSNTPDGFIGFFNMMADNYKLQKVYIIKGGSGVGKSTFIRKFATRLIERAKERGTNLTVDYILCSADPNSLDGAIFSELGLAVIDGTFPHITDPKYPGMVEEIIDFAAFIDPNKIKASREELGELMKQRKACFRRAYSDLKQARELHLKVEAAYIPAVDFMRIDAVLERLLQKYC